MIRNHLNNIHLMQANVQDPAVARVDTPLVQKILRKAGIQTCEQKKYPKSLKLECKQRIVELKLQNKKIHPKKVRLDRLTLLGVASLVSIVGGVILGVAGIGLCAAGVSLPAGLALLGVGVGLVALGTPGLIYFNKKFNQEKLYQHNKNQINTLNKLAKEPAFRNFVRRLREELEITHLSTVAFALKYDLTKLYNLVTVYEQDKLKPKINLEDAFYKDYTSYLNVLAEKMLLTNQMLREMDGTVRKINAAIIKSSKKDSADIPLLHGCRKVSVRRAKYLARARIKLLQDTPKENAFSPNARQRFYQIKNMSLLKFAHLVLCKLN